MNTTAIFFSLWLWLCQVVLGTQSFAFLRRLGRIVARVVLRSIPRFLYELEFLGVDGFAVVLWFDFNGLFDVQEIVSACLIHFGLRGLLRAWGSVASPGSFAPPAS